jgi:hypothetical protein
MAQILLAENVRSHPVASVSTLFFAEGLYNAGSGTFYRTSE